MFHAYLGQKPPSRFVGDTFYNCSHFFPSFCSFRQKHAVREKRSGGHPISDILINDVKYGAQRIEMYHLTAELHGNLPKTSSAPHRPVLWCCIIQLEPLDNCIQPLFLIFSNPSSFFFPAFPNGQGKEVNHTVQEGTWIRVPLEILWMRFCNYGLITLILHIFHLS